MADSKDKAAANSTSATAAEVPAAPAPTPAAGPADATAKADSKVDDIAASLSGLMSAKDAATPAKEAASAAPDAKKSEVQVDSNLRESTHEVQVTLADQQADPNSPLYSAKSFESLGLHENLLKGIYAMKYQKPSKIQEKALPLLLHNP